MLIFLSLKPKQQLRINSLTRTFWREIMTREATVRRKSNTVITERKARHSKTSLVLDLDKCTGCNLCWTVCPRYAIEED